MSRVKLIIALALVWLAAVAAQQSNFVGGNPTPMDAKSVRTLRLKFPAGSRSNWHSHANGQLLMEEPAGASTPARFFRARE